MLIANYLRKSIFKFKEIERNPYQTFKKSIRIGTYPKSKLLNSQHDYSSDTSSISLRIFATRKVLKSFNIRLAFQKAHQQ